MTAPRRLAAAALLPPIVWGSTYAVAGSAFPVHSPILEVELRLVPAAAVALLVPGLRSLAAPAKTATLGLLNFTFAFYGLFLAIRYLPGGTAAVLIASQPIITMLLMRGLYRRHLETRQWVAGLSGLAGVALVVSANLERGALAGVLGALGCVLSQALGAVLIDRWSGDFDARGSLAWQLTLGALVAMPFALVAAPSVELTWQLGAAVAYVSVLGTTVCALIWYGTITRMSPSRASLLLLLVPVVALILDGVTGATDNTPTEWVGALVVIGSVLVGTRRPVAEPAPPAPSSDRVPALVRGHPADTRRTNHT
ncbi:MAG: EamA family transporter [Nocardioides sp.]